MFDEEEARKCRGGKDLLLHLNPFLAQELGESELLDKLPFFTLPCIIRQECICSFSL